MSCKALSHWELILPEQQHQELFEGCRLPDILTAQVLPALPQASQRQHKSRKVYIALDQKYPCLMTGRLLVEEDAAVTDGKVSTSLFRGYILSCTRVYVLLFTMFYRLRGRNDF